MASYRAPIQQSWLITMITVILVVAVLALAREVLIPIALAVLLSFVLAPLCDRLELWKLGRIPSVMIATAMSFLLVGLIAWVVVSQAIDLAGQLPRYQNNIRQKIQSLQLPAGGPLGRAAEGIQRLTTELQHQAAEAEDGGGATPASQSDEKRDAVPVKVVEQPVRPLEAFRDAFTPLWKPLVSAGIVIIFVVFMLLQRDDLRDRVLRLIGQGRLTVATQAIDDAAHRVSRYLLMLLVVNSSYGMIIAAGLFLIGLPNAVLWGVLAALLRFIPYAGPWVGALLPISFSLAVFNHWSPVLMTIGLFIVVELISNNLMEPFLYGTHTGISPVAILASAVFWAWLWGPMGLVLATPLTVCVVVMGRYIPRLEFLSVLLSDQPGLTPGARVYQRLLAFDQDDVYEFCDAFLTDRSMLELYEEVLLPAMSMAERDRHHRQLDPVRQDAVYQTMRDLIDELAERSLNVPVTEDVTTPQSSTTAASAAAEIIAEPKAPRTIVCIPARDDADELVCKMLAHLLAIEGATAEVVSHELLISEKLGEIQRHDPDAVCISGLPPQAVTRTRHLCARVAKQFPELRTIIGFWHFADLEQIRRRISMCDPRNIVATMEDAIRLLRGP